MKRNIILAVLITALAITMAACSSSDEQVVNVYNWGEYIDQSIFEDFTEETGIEVNYLTYESNEQLYGVLKGGGASYDVIIPSDYMISRLIEEDMLEKINFDNVPNVSQIDPTYMSMSYDPNGEYSVPYGWGTVGIIYNSAEIDEEITSWSAMFDEQYAGQILQFSNSRDAIGTALYYLGYSVNTTDEAQLNEAYELLLEQKPFVQKWVMDQMYDLLEGGEALIGAYYAGDYISMLENNPDLRFVVPEEGSNIFVDAMCIPKGAANKDNAEAFINFMSGAEISYRNMQETGYASPNPTTNEMMAEDYDLSDPTDAYIYSVLFPTSEVTSRCESYSNLPVETLDLYDKMWIDLFAE